MKVIHVVPTVMQEADGVGEVVRNLFNTMDAPSNGVRLATLDVDIKTGPPSYLTGFPLGWGPRRLGISPLLHRWLQTEVNSGSVNIIHSHGLWMMPNVYAGNVCLKSNCQLVITPHGSMSTWSLGRNSLMKKIFWKFWQGPAARAAACFHATAESEFEEIRQLGFKQPVCIIPLGVNVPPLDQTQYSGRRQLLFLARIHLKKGVDVLLHAWKEVENKFPDWDLVVAGPDNGGYLAEMQALAVELELKRVVFRGRLTPEEKLQAYRDASLYVLPTYYENFGITVAEALAAGTPVIVTHAAPWAGLVDEGAGWWIEVGVAPLVACFEQALNTTPQKLKGMGIAGHEWMKRDFSWERRNAQLLVTYRWLLEGGEPPSWVRLD